MGRQPARQLGPAHVRVAAAAGRGADIDESGHPGASQQSGDPFGARGPVPEGDERPGAQGGGRHGQADRLEPGMPCMSSSVIGSIVTSGFSCLPPECSSAGELLELDA